MRRALVVDIQRTWDQNIVMQYSCSYFERRKVNPRFHLWVWPRHLSHSSPTLFYSSTFWGSSRFGYLRVVSTASILIFCFQCTSLHPRLALLTGTIYQAFDDLWHTGILTVKYNRHILCGRKQLCCCRSPNSKIQIRNIGNSVWMHSQALHSPSQPLRVDQGAFNSTKKAPAPHSSILGFGLQSLTSERQDQA